MHFSGHLKTGEIVLLVIATVTKQATIVANHSLSKIRCHLQMPMNDNNWSVFQNISSDIGFFIDSSIFVAKGFNDKDFWRFWMDIAWDSQQC